MDKWTVGSDVQDSTLRPQTIPVMGRGGRTTRRGTPTVEQTIDEAIPSTIDSETARQSLQHRKFNYKAGFDANDINPIGGRCYATYKEEDGTKRPSGRR